MKKNLPCPTLSPVLWAKGWETTTKRSKFIGPLFLAVTARACFGGYKNSRTQLKRSPEIDGYERLSTSRRYVS